MVEKLKEIKICKDMTPSSYKLYKLNYNSEEFSLFLIDKGIVDYNCELAKKTLLNLASFIYFNALDSSSEFKNDPLFKKYFKNVHYSFTIDSGMRDDDLCKFSLCQADVNDFNNKNLNKYPIVFCPSYKDMEYDEFKIKNFCYWNMYLALHTNAYYLISGHGPTINPNLISSWGYAII